MSLPGGTATEIHGPQHNPILSDEENPSELDPNSRTFSYEAWSQHRLQQFRYHPKTEISVAFQNLIVNGYGSPTDYQKTFVDLPALLLDSVRKLLGRYHMTKLNILRNVDGLVLPGEMLLVLGRPGSGCSTLLKVLAGQTYGLHLDSSSKLNYQGMSKFLPQSFALSTNSFDRYSCRQNAL